MNQWITDLSILKKGEGVAYKALNSHPEMKCPISGKITQTWQKVGLKL
jgi:hypothetical protein